MNLKNALGQIKAYGGNLHGGWLLGLGCLTTGDTARAATSSEVQDLRRETRALKEAVADLTLENRLLKKSMIADGGDDE